MTAALRRWEDAMSTALHGHVSSERLLHFVLWFAQGLLAATFAAMALLKLLSDRDRLVEIMSWTESTPSWLVYTLGTLELIGAFIVAAPAVTRTPQRIVGFTAALFCALMVVATLLHALHAELRLVPVTLALAGLSAFVAWGRIMHKPLETLEQNEL
jgi:hypothetical protein